MTCSRSYAHIHLNFSVYITTPDRCIRFPIYPHTPKTAGMMWRAYWKGEIWYERKPYAISDVLWHSSDIIFRFIYIYSNNMLYIRIVYDPFMLGSSFAIRHIMFGFYVFYVRCAPHNLTCQNELNWSRYAAAWARTYKYVERKSV